MTKSSGKRTQFTKENAAENGSKGGKASGEARRRKRAEKERFATLISLPLSKGVVKDIDDLRNFAAISGRNITVGDAIAVRIIQKALSGDKDAAKLIYNMLGESNPAPPDSAPEIEDDGFLDALNELAVEDWSDGGDD